MPLGMYGSLCKKKLKTGAWSEATIGSAVMPYRVSGPRKANHLVSSAVFRQANLEGEVQGLKVRCSSQKQELVCDGADAQPCVMLGSCLFFIGEMK